MAITYEHAVDVNCSPEEAFALVDDLPRTPEWLGPCTKLVKVSPGPNQEGDQLHYEYKQGGQAGVMQGEIVQRVLNERLVCRYFDKMMEVTVDFTVSPSSSGARLTHVITLAPQTFMMKMMTPMIKLGLPKQTKDAMAALQKLLENR